MESQQGERVVNGRHNNSSHSVLGLTRFSTVADRSVLREEAFRRMISLEKKRTERSQKCFVLTLFEIKHLSSAENAQDVLGKILSALASTTRETDVTGWYKRDCVVGVLFTEVPVKDRGSVLGTIETRVGKTLGFCLSTQQFGQVGISFQVFPAEPENKIIPKPSQAPLYASLSAGD